MRRKAIFFIGLFLTSTSNSTLAKKLAPARPSHHYIYSENGVYFYAAALTPQQKKDGYVSGDALAYRYFGVNDLGEHVLAVVTGNGSISYYAYCKNPCRVIRLDSGDRIVNNQSLLIGAVFADAMRGVLKNTNPKKDDKIIRTPRGVTLISSADAPVFATVDGIAWVKQEQGSSLEISNQAGFISRYGNLARILVKSGEVVKRGQLIGIAGAGEKGLSAVTYEIEIAGELVDPRPFLK